jgi:hypothetical protein
MYMQPLFFVTIVFCQAGVSSKDRSFVQMSPTECGLTEFDPETTTMRLPRSEGSCAIIKILGIKEIFRHIRKIAKKTISFLLFVRLSVCPSVSPYGTTRLSQDEF